ncbi:MAG: succinate dehydrogenase/fumarate reductase iron-sulfur subunit [Deltaproteobacteria bacterium]|jgi:succinate dehydrogenase / fumarate reductase iron-sulfur subunit|nr:succinate dehydrogenase/fumarate reductase iron-sulfur subunit [Deltaproteobacteria bacterium]
MDIILHVWRQKNCHVKGHLETYKVANVSADMSFIEMLDMLNAQLTEKGIEPIAFECDCLEGICGTCSMVINGKPHGPESGTTTCQLHMRKFKDGDHIFVEPWRSKAFPILKDLVVQRSAFDRIMQAGGFVSVNTGGARDANNLLIPKESADLAMDAAQCIGCGACVAACKNGSAMLFVSAKVSQFALLPQGQPEAARRAALMVEAMDNEGFGNCTNTYDCEGVCPKEISADFIAKLNREFIKTKRA